jgi:hypothetical protein
MACVPRHTRALVRSSRTGGDGAANIMLPQHVIEELLKSNERLSVLASDSLFAETLCQRGSVIPYQRAVCIVVGLSSGAWTPAPRMEARGITLSPVC